MRDLLSARFVSIVNAVEVALAASLWGCWSLFLRPYGLPSSATTPLVFLAVGLLLLPLARREGMPSVWNRNVVTLLVVYAAVDVLNVFAFFTAMQLTTVAVAVLTHYLMPLAVAVLAPFIDRERIRGAFAAALVATIGLVPVLGPSMIASRNELIGALLGIFSAIAYASGVFMARRLIPRIGVLRALSYHAILGGIMLLPLCPLRSLTSHPATAWLWLLVGILLAGVFGGVLFMHGLSRIGATRAAILAYFEPLVAVIVGWAAWGERLSPLALFGALLIVMAGAWISQARSRPVMEGRKAI